MANSELTFVGEECSICLDVFENQMIGVSEACGHKNCLTCLWSWLRRLHNQTCPYCRSYFQNIIIFEFHNGVYRRRDHSIPFYPIDVEFEAEELTLRFLLAHEIHRSRTGEEIPMQRLFPMWIQNRIPNNPPIIIDQTILNRLKHLAHARIQFILNKYRNFPNTPMDETNLLRNDVYPYVDHQIMEHEEHVANHFQLPVVLYLEFMSRKGNSRLAPGQD